MDDIIGGGDSEEESCLMRAEIGEILSEHGFMIKEWIYTGAKNQFHSSNDQRQVRLLLGVSDMEDSVQGVLGMKWNVEDDTIQISINQRSMSEKFTKRIVLSVVNGVYDPLGLLAPYIIRAKILLRKMNRN